MAIRRAVGLAGNRALRKLRTVKLAGNRAFASCERSSWLETGPSRSCERSSWLETEADGIHRGQVGWKLRSGGIHRGRFGWKAGRGDSPRVSPAGKRVVAIRHGSVRLESGSWRFATGRSGWKVRSWRIATGRSGWKVDRGDSPRVKSDWKAGLRKLQAVNLAGNRAFATCERSIWLETRFSQVANGQVGSKPRSVESWR